MKHKGVEGGTITGPPLCRTCRWATYIRGRSEGQELLYCQIVTSPTGRGRSMPFEAYECNHYDDKSRPSLSMMKEAAWILRTDEFKNAIGFFSPRQMMKFYKDEEEE